MSAYRAAREEGPFGGTHPVMADFRAASDAITASQPVIQRPNLRVAWSAGAGNWARVPWIALLDQRETTTTQRGVYCVYLFRQDMRGVYLTFNQGVTEPQQALGRPKAREFLKNRAQRIRQTGLESLAPSFRTDGGIDLAATGDLGSWYEESTIAYTYYAAGAVPDDTQLFSDLSSALSAYDAYLARDTATQVAPPTERAWIFQSNPTMFDLRGAVRSLPVMTWLVKQHADAIRAGDKVYLWESGPSAGIVGRAVVGSAPQVQSIRPREREFVLSGEKLDGSQLRVELQQVTSLATPLDRSTILETPGLRELSILRAPQGTNFPVTQDQAETLEALLSDRSTSSPRPINANLSEITASFTDYLRAAQVSFGERHEELARTLVASLATKRFVILTGLSGSGKTQLALQFGRWCGDSQHLVVPVRPDWTSPEAVLGHEDVLLPTSGGRRAWYVPEPLTFMLRAAADPERPYLLVLDEMNLAHVERYFADLLSGMETDIAVLPNLHEEEDGSWRVPEDGPTRIPLPKNLFVIGTVNVDETTYMFSPKVLDRANTIEFRVGTSELRLNARKPAAVQLDTDAFGRGFQAVAGDEAFQDAHPHPERDSLGEALASLHGVLADGGYEFGHRVFFEAVRFASMYYAAGDANLDTVVDLQLLQKMLPKLHGARRRLEPMLNALGEYCMQMSVTSAGTGGSFDPLSTSTTEARLPRSLGKIQRMTRQLRANQFASFAE